MPETCLDTIGKLANIRTLAKTTWRLHGCSLGWGGGKESTDAVGLYIDDILRCGWLSQPVDAAHESVHVGRSRAASCHGNNSPGDSPTLLRIASCRAADLRTVDDTFGGCSTGNILACLNTAHATIDRRAAPHDNALTDRTGHATRRLGASPRGEPQRSSADERATPHYRQHTGPDRPRQLQFAFRWWDGS